MRHLIPKQIDANGLKPDEVKITHQTILEYIVRYYTREAGVRNLEREISKICRKFVKEILMNNEIKKVPSIIRRS